VEIQSKDLEKIPGKEDPIGRGSYGQVYVLKYYGMEVAFKKLIFAPRNIVEAQALKSLRHDNIVKLYGVVTDPMNFGICMEYLQEGSLYYAIAIKSRIFINYEIQILIAGMIKGMKYLHDEQNIVHRDLKSANVLLKKDIEGALHPVICDFGWSKILEATDGKMESFAGTPYWMAPEILRSEKYDNKCDVYSFGLIVWEIVNRKIPFEDLGIIDLQQKVGNEGMRPENSSKPNMNDKIFFLIEESWKQDPLKRPSFSEIYSKYIDTNGNFVEPYPGFVNQGICE